MATDYDAPRNKDEDGLATASLEALRAAGRNDAQSGAVDEDEAESAEAFELPGADLSSEELSVKVAPPQTDEFTCGVCFLVMHRSRLSRVEDGVMICLDCDG